VLLLASFTMINSSVKWDQKYFAIFVKTKSTLLHRANLKYLQIVTPYLF
jgi:hypothetical protein